MCICVYTTRKAYSPPDPPVPRPRAPPGPAHHPSRQVRRSYVYQEVSSVCILCCRCHASPFSRYGTLSDVTFRLLVMDIIPTPRAGRIPSTHLLGGLEVDPHQRRHVLSRHSTTTVPHRRNHLAGSRKRSDTGGLGACTTRQVCRHMTPTFPLPITSDRYVLLMSITALTFSGGRAAKASEPFTRRRGSSAILTPAFLALAVDAPGHPLTGGRRVAGSRVTGAWNASPRSIRPGRRKRSPHGDTERLRLLVAPVPSMPLPRGRRIEYLC